MGNTVIDDLREQRDEARSAAIALAEADGFSPEDPTFQDVQKRATELDKRVEALGKLHEQRASADALDAQLARVGRRKAASSGTSEGSVETRSFGEQFVASDAFTEYRGRGTSSMFSGLIQKRALPTSLSELVTAGWSGDPYQVQATDPPAPTPLAGVVTNIQVSQNAVEYVVWGTEAGGPAKVAEGAAKPSVEYGPTVTADTLDNIAVWTQLTRQLIEDQPAVRDAINAMMRRDILIAEEAEISGAITGATLPSITYGSAAAGDTLLGAIRVGIGTVEAAGYNPNAVLLHPNDYGVLDIEVMKNSGIPASQSSLWGLQIISSSGQTEGTATVGDFGQGVNRFYRSDLQAYITDSHADTFTSNVFTLLLERRSLAAVVRPNALVDCTVGA